jgi:hypothetical protein
MLTRVKKCLVEKQNRICFDKNGAILISFDNIAGLEFYRINVAVRSVNADKLLS